MGKLTNALDALNGLNEGQQKIIEILEATKKQDQDQEDQARRDEIAKDSKDKAKKSSGPGFLSRSGSKIKKTLGSGGPDIAGMAAGFGIGIADQMFGDREALHKFIEDNNKVLAAVTGIAAILAADYVGNRIVGSAEGVKKALQKNKTYAGGRTNAQFDDFKAREAARVSNNANVKNTQLDADKAAAEAEAKRKIKNGEAEFKKAQNDARIAQAKADAARLADDNATMREMQKKAEAQRLKKLNTDAVRYLQNEGYKIDNQGTLRNSKGHFVGDAEQTKVIADAEKAGKKSPLKAIGKVASAAGKTLAAVGPFISMANAATDEKSKEAGLGYWTRTGMHTVADYTGGAVDLATNTAGFTKDVINKGWDNAQWGESSWGTNFAEKQVDMMRWALAEKNPELRAIQAQKNTLRDQMNPGADPRSMDPAELEAHYDEAFEANKKLKRLQIKEAEIRLEIAEEEKRKKLLPLSNVAVDANVERIQRLNQQLGITPQPIIIDNSKNVQQEVPQPGGAAAFMQKMSTLTP